MKAFINKVRSHPKFNLYLGIAIAIVITGILIYIFKRIHDAKAEKEKQKAIALSDFVKYTNKTDWANALKDYLDPKKGNHLSETKGKHLKQISKDLALQIANQLDDAKGTFRDDETSAMTAINSIPSLSDLLQISAVMTNKSGSHSISEPNIIAYFISFMNEEEQSKVFDILDSKPAFLFA